MKKLLCHFASITLAISCLIFAQASFADNKYSNNQYYSDNHTDKKISVEDARNIVAPFYDALNKPATKDVAKLIEQATTPDWVSCVSNTACVPRDAIIQRFIGRGEAIPDLTWTISDIQISDNQVIVRSEATGTPVLNYLGINASGKTFQIMAIDIHIIKHKKIIRSYHIEDWASAVRQVNVQ